MTESIAPALFLDRDGVINHEVGYLHRTADVRWVEGIFPLCRLAMSHGYRLVVVTNQSGIGRGLYSTEDFEALMQWMGERFAHEQAPLQAVYHCPYHPVEGQGEWRREHEDRKPGPGMLLRAAREHNLDLRCSVLVGDRCSDIAAAHAAGLREAFLLRGTEVKRCSDVCTTVDSLDEVAQWFAREHGSTSVSEALP